jgi:hypothetical protein
MPEVPLRIQLLLRPECRNHASIAELLREIRALGLEPSGTGAATVSVRADPRAYARLFGRVDTGELPIPEPLSAYVESATIAPQHEYMDDGDDE